MKNRENEKMNLLSMILQGLVAFSAFIISAVVWKTCAPAGMLSVFMAVATIITALAAIISVILICDRWTLFEEKSNDVIFHISRRNDRSLSRKIS